MRRYTVTKRFYAFLALLAALMLGVSAWIYFRPLPLIGVLGRYVDTETLAEIEMTSVAPDGQPQQETLTDATALRGVLAALDGASMRRQLFPGAAGDVVPGEAFRLRLKDRSDREAVVDLAGRQVTLNLSKGYWLLEPDIQRLAAALNASG